MKSLITTICAAAMTVAQPTFADQSEDILGTWDCIIADDEMNATDTITYFSNGTFSSEGHVVGKLSEFATVEFTGTGTGEWSIHKGIVATAITSIELSLLLLNGNDHSTGPIADAMVDTMLEEPEFRDDIVRLGSEHLTLRDLDDGTITECTRFVGA